MFQQIKQLRSSAPVCAFPLNLSSAAPLRHTVVAAQTHAPLHMALSRWLQLVFTELTPSIEAVPRTHSVVKIPSEATPLAGVAHHPSRGAALGTPVYNKTNTGGCCPAWHKLNRMRLHVMLHMFL